MSRFLVDDHGPRLRGPRLPHQRHAPRGTFLGGRPPSESPSLALDGLTRRPGASSTNGGISYRPDSGEMVRRRCRGNSDVDDKPPRPAVLLTLVMVLGALWVGVVSVVLGACVSAARGDRNLAWGAGSRRPAPARADRLRLTA